MRCLTCNQKLPSNNHVVIEGNYFCVACFLEQYNNSPVAQITCQVCGSIPLASVERTKKDSKREKFGSTTSLSSTQSNKISGTAQRVSTAISKVFHRPRSPTPVTSESNSTEKKPPRPPPARDKTCQVCYEEKSSKHFRPSVTHQCRQAERSICDQCVYRHIQQLFQEMCTDDVRCPELQCGMKYDYATIRDILRANNDKHLFERYERFQVQHQLEQMEEFIWCSNPKCQMGQLNDGGRLNNIVTCIRCYQKTCFVHKTKWHEGLTCAQFDLMGNDQQRETLKWLNQNTKTCPNCPYQIEKNDGCDHMTCIKCKHEFCWSCLANFDRIRRDGNHRHENYCKHYASRSGR